MGEQEDDEKLPIEDPGVLEDPLEVEEVIEVVPIQVRTLDDLAKMGRYAFLVILFSEFCLLQGAGNMTYMIFGGAAPYKVSCIGENFTIENVCKQFPDSWEHLPTVQNCTIKTEYEFRSVNVAFDMLCHKGKWVKWSISVQMAGVLFGTLFTGMMSDMFGRLRTLSLSLFFSTLFGFLCATPTSFAWLTIYRTAQGPFTGGIIGTFLVYLTEQIPRKHRFTVSTVVAWSFNYILVTIMAYFSQDWRTFQFYILVCSSPAYIFYWFVYESPRWLVQHGRLDEARDILEKIQARDGHDEERHKHIDRLLEVEYQAQHARQEKKSLCNLHQLFSNRKLAGYVAVVSVGVFITSMTNYALAFNLDKLSGSIFANALILGIFRWSINLFTGLLDYKMTTLGRKCVHFLSQGLTGMAIGIIAGVYLLGKGQEYSTVTRVCTIWATSMSTQVFITKSVVTMEIFPTLLRNQAISFKSIFSRIGIIVAPFVFLLSSWPAIPYGVLSLLIVFDAFLFQGCIPETKGLNLPDRIPQSQPKTEPLLKNQA